MDPLEHYRLLEVLEEMTANLRVTPQLPQRLRARGVGRLVVADTDILDGLQLAKIADKDHGEFSGSRSLPAKNARFLWPKRTVARRSS